MRLVEQAAKELLEIGIDCEIIDIQSLLPFDSNHDILKSVMKTNRLLVIDEDVPGGASAFILQQVIDEQNAYRHLDSKPETLTAKAHRPAYGTDGDYFSKPSIEDTIIPAPTVEFVYLSIIIKLPVYLFSWYGSTAISLSNDIVHFAISFKASSVASISSNVLMFFLNSIELKLPFITDVALLII